MTIYTPSLRLRSLLRRLRLPLIGLLLAVAACDLTPVEIPLGDPMVVVHGVIRSDQAHQFIVVERSFTGEDDKTFLGYPIPTKGGPPIPLEGAVVRVTNLDLPDDTCGSPLPFIEEIVDANVVARAGVYQAPAGCPTMRPGDRLELYVETPEGEVVEGSTIVTGMESATLTVLGETVPFGSDTLITFNKDRDILRLSVEPVAGRLLQVQVLRIGELDIHQGEDIWPGARIHVDTMSVAIPGDLVDAGGWSDGGDVFRAGRDYIMTVSVTDVNYYDFSRSNNNNFTGKGLLNHLSGGIGVFGSLAARSLPLRVISEFDDEREGEYWVRGTLQGIDVDAVLTVYAVRSADETEASALLTGDWLNRQEIPGSEGDIGWLPAQVDRLLFEGTLDGNLINLVALYPGADGVKRIQMSGDRKPDASFVFAVVDSMRIRSIPVGNVTVSQR